MSMKIYYIHDPMCSWCWGFRPVWQELKALLKVHYPELDRQYVLGGLAPDSDQPMPEEMQRYIRANWQRIQNVIPDTEFNYDFWQVCQPRRSTYPACRAVLAACKQNLEYQDQMIFAIQQAYYLQAKNPSDISVLAECAAVAGLDVEQFISDIHSQLIEQQLQQQLDLYHLLRVRAGVTGFPGLALMNGDIYHQIPVDYHRADTIFSIMKTLLEANNNR